MATPVSFNDDDIKKALGYLEQAHAILAAPISTQPATTVKAGQSIQAAIDACPDFGAIAVEPATYNETLTMGAKTVTIQPTIPIPAGRRSPLWAPVIVTSGADSTATIKGTGRVILSGLEFVNTNPDATILTDTGQHTLLDRVLIMGDPTKGQHRGITAHGISCQYDGIYVDDCGLPKRDACALGGWDGTKDLKVTNSYFGGSAQSVLFGGADSASADRIPDTILFQHCYLGKNPEWYNLGWDMKTGLELKAARHFAIEDSVIEYAGVAGGQSAYVILLTPRNQNGHAPWSEVTDVRIERVAARYGGAGVLMLGKDYTNPSGPLARVTLRDVAFYDLDAKSPVWTQPDATPPHYGSGRIVAMSDNPQQVTMERITATGTHLAAALYITKPATGLVMRDWKMPTTAYGFKIDAGGSGVPALKAFMPDAVIELTATDQGAQNVPPLP